MLAVPPVRLMPAPAPAAALPDAVGVPQGTFLGTSCATKRGRRVAAPNLVTGEGPRGGCGS